MSQLCWHRGVSCLFIFSLIGYLPSLLAESGRFIDGDTDYCEDEIEGVSFEPVENKQKDYEPDLSHLPLALQQKYQAGQQFAKDHEQELTAIRELRSQISERRYKPLNLDGIFDIKSENEADIIQLQQMMLQLSGEKTLEQSYGENIRITGKVSDNFNESSLARFSEINLGYASVAAVADGSRLRLKYTVPSFRLRLGKNKDTLVNDFFTSEVGREFTRYLGESNAGVSFYVSRVVEKATSRYEVTLNGILNGLILPKLQIDLVFYYDELYESYWLEYLLATDLNQYHTAFSETAWYDDETAIKLLESCEKQTLGKVEYSYKIGKTEISPDTFYFCEENGCKSAYYMTVSFKSDKTETSGVACTMDANTGELLKTRWFAPDPLVTIKAEIKEVPYCYESMGANLLCRTVRIPYSQFVVDGSGYYTNVDGESNYSGSTCFILPTSDGHSDNSLFQNETLSGNTVFWDCDTNPNYLFYTGYGSLYDYFPLQLKAPFQVQYFLTWMRDAISPYAYSVQYKENGVDKKWKYYIGTNYDDGYAFGAGKLEFRYRAPIAPEVFQDQPGAGSVTHEFGHALDDVNLSDNEWGQARYPNSNNPWDIIPSNTLALHSYCPHPRNVSSILRHFDSEFRVVFVC